MWSLYDDLIDSVSKDITVESAVSGHRWTMLRTSDGRTGVAMTMEGAQFPSCRPESLVGTSLQEAAALVKSWNFADASARSAQAAEQGLVPDKRGIREHITRITQFEGEKTVVFQ